MTDDHGGPERRQPIEVEIEEHVEATPEEVFDYLADGDRAPDGDDGIVTLGDLLVSEPPHRIAWRVDFEGERGSYPGTVDVTLAPDGTGTRVRVVHRSNAQPRSLATRGPRMLALAA